MVQMEHQMTSNNIEFKASEFRNNFFLVQQSLPIIYSLCPKIDDPLAMNLDKGQRE